jgi:hypothetical protein
MIINRLLAFIAIVISVVALVGTVIIAGTPVPRGLQGPIGKPGSNANACQEIATIVSQLNLDFASVYGTFTIPPQCIEGGLW